MVQLNHVSGEGYIMPQIIPIKDLKNTGEISEMCHKADEPIYVTKNGYGDMVIMSMEAYEKTLYMNDIYQKLQSAEFSVENGNVKDGFDALNNIKEKYGL